MIKAIIFDCFGVLITDALEQLVADLRQTDSKTAGEIVAIITAANKGQISRQESTEHVARLLKITVDDYISAIKNGELKNQPLLDYIYTLRATYKTALLSNISSGGLAVRFTNHELHNYFDTVIVSGEVGFAKPDPQMYELAAHKLGVQPNECLFIDDRVDYCHGAEAIGMQSHIYTNNQTLFNYLKTACVTD